MLDLTGYKLTFDDEFDARSISQTGANTTWSDIRPEWRYDAESDIGFGHSSFVDAGSGYDPFSVSGGALSIEAVPDRTPYGYPGSWESGLISTQGSFSQTYGYFEMRAQLSSAPGSWDAFWLLSDAPSAQTTPSAGWQELDVVEHYGNDDPGTYSTIHTTDDTPASALQVYSRDPARTTGYHTYGMDWEPDRISFYVDGQLMGSQATPSDMQGPMYLLADLATEHGATDEPMTSRIDYIRAYSKDPAAVAIQQEALSAPDGGDPGLYGAAAAAATTPEAPGPADAPSASGAAASETQPAASATSPAGTTASTPVVATSTASSTTAPVGTQSAVPSPIAVAPAETSSAASAAPAALQPPTMTLASPLSAGAAASVEGLGEASAAEAAAPAAALAVTLHSDGSRTVDVQAPGQTAHSDAFDTFLNHGQAGTRFVFDPGYGVDVVRQFRAAGPGHDVIDLPSADFRGVAEVLRDTHASRGAAVIVDPATGDRLRLPGVTKAQLVHNRGDFAFHA